MTEDEYYQYIQLSGPAIKKRLSEKLEYFKNIKDKDKREKAIDEMVQQEREKAKLKIQSGRSALGGQKLTVAIQDMLSGLLSEEMV